MLDDLLAAIRLGRNVDAASPRTTLGKGRKVVLSGLPWLLIAGGAGMTTGLLQVPDGAILSLYALAPFFLDSTMFLESLPLLSRMVPRATILVELGLEMGAVGMGISLSIVYAIYRKIGAASMALSWLFWKRNN